MSVEHRPHAASGKGTPEAQPARFRGPDRRCCRSVAAVLAYGVLAPSARGDAVASVSSVSPAAAVVYDPCVAPAVLEGDTGDPGDRDPPAAVAVTTRKAAPVSARHAAPTSTPTRRDAEDSRHGDSGARDSRARGQDHEDSTHSQGLRP